VASTVLVIIVVFAAVLPYIEAGENSDRKEMGEVAWSVVQGSAIKANVTVLGSSPDSRFIADSLAAVARHVNVTSEAKGLDPSGVLCVDCTGMSEEHLLAAIAPIREAILDGTPVIFVNDTSGIVGQVIDGQNVSYVGAANENGSPIAVRALKHDPLGGRSGSLDLGGQASDRAQLASALSIAHNWSADRLENTNASGFLTDHVHVYESFSYLYFSGEAYAPYGRFTVSNTYIRTVWNSSYDGDGWSVHYRVESDPGYGSYSNDYTTRSMAVGSTFGKEVGLNRYDPGTAYGTESVGVHLSPNDYGSLSHWEYDVRDVIVLDHSNFGLNMFELDHIPDRGSDVSRSPYIIEPGVGMSVERNAGITFHEGYTIDWQRPSPFAWESRSASLTIEGRVA
jgi:hypothetical protein